MTVTTQDEAKRPWFKQPWLWFVLSIPIASVILSSIMVTVAVKGKDSLVSDNYYKDGMAINQTIEQDRLAETIQLKPTLAIEDNNVIIALNGDTSHASYQQQPFLTLKLLHPTVSDKDIILKLLPSADGRFIAELTEALEGRRYVDLYAFDNSWRVREEVIFPVTSVQLRADTSAQ